MTDAPPPPPPSAEERPAAAAEAAPLAAKADGAVVIDLTRLVPPPPAGNCGDEPADPFQPAEIVVCEAAPDPPRLGPMIGPVDDGFGSAIPRARIRISDKAEAQANLAKSPVGGFDAEGAEVRVKIDF